MPANTVTPMSFDFADAPSGDLTLDQIFTFDDGTPQTNNTPQETTPEGVVETEPFLQTATGTVYKSADEAVKGIEHKDALIAEQRRQLQELTGRDPLKNNTRVTEEPTSYLDNPQKYFEDIRKAKSEAELMQIQSTFMDQKFSPYAPVLAAAARQQAIEATAAEMPEITTFLRSPEYTATLDRYPLLKQSIQISETNPQVSGDLGQLYKMAATLSAGLNVSKIAQGVRQTPIEARPTVSSTPVTPPGTTQVAPPSLATPQGRQSIMEQQRAKGVEDIRF